jgi:hypothetical protein
MGHRMDRCDVLDMLEEAVVTRRGVVVDTFDGKHFADRVRDIVMEDGEEWAVFRDHDKVPVGEITYCGRAEPAPEASYEAKL